MEISKMYHKDISYKLALDTVAAEYLNSVNDYNDKKYLPLYAMAHTLAVMMGLTVGLVLEDLEKAVNKLWKAA